MSGTLTREVRKVRRPGGLPHLVGLDGLRAVAVIAVVLYHADITWLPGALLYYSNWLNIFSDTSYFDFIGRPPMLKHLWSLAVEEQFYIFWPTIALVAYRWRGARAVFQVAVIGAVLSTLALATGSFMGDMPMPNDPSRLYFGTDTHAMGVLVGAALAVIWRPSRTAPILPRQAAHVISAAGCVGLLLLVACFMYLGEYSSFLYRGGFLVVALISAVVVAAASHRGVAFGRVLGMRPMKWVGERSYGIYLWHWPLFVVTRPGQDMPLTGIPALILRIGLLLVISQLSYKYLEMPMRRGAFGRWWGRFRAGELARPGRAGIAAAVAAVLLMSFVTLRIATAQAPVMASGSNISAADQLPADARLAAIPPARDAVDMVGVASQNELNWARRLAAGSAAAAARAQALTQAAESSYGIEASAFGDSVLLGASPALERGAFNLDLYAKVAQQAAGAEDAIIGQAKAKALRSLVILHTGNNGIITEEQLTKILEAVSGVPRVVVVNNKVPRPWSAPNNRVFASVVPRYPNARLVDWDKIATGHPQYFVKDGVHLTWEGAQAYAKAIEAAAAQP